MKDDPTDERPFPDSAEDDLELEGYQDELDTSDEISDQATEDETDDPTETLQVPADEFKDQMDGLDVDEDSDDIREFIEDADEHDDNSAVSIE